MAKAAEQLGVSQPAVSEAIAGLEHALHIRRSTFGKPAKVIAAPKT
jgi:predicted transcriptional regulator